MNHPILLIMLLTLFLPYGHAENQTPYKHDKWGTLPKDTIKEFIAFTASMDSKDDNGAIVKCGV